MSNKKNIIIICLATATVVVSLLGFTGFFTKMNSPYETVVRSIFQKINNSEIINDYNKVKMNLSFNSKEIDVLNNLSLSTETSYDKDKLLEYSDTKILKSNDSILNLITYYESGKLYLKSEQIIDKILSFDLNVDGSDNEKKTNNNEVTPDDVKYLEDKIQEALLNAFKNIEPKKETTTLTINEKNEKVTNNYYIIDNSNFDTYKNNILSTLKDDKTYEVISRLTSTDINEVKKNFENAFESNSGGSFSFRINVYTKGLMNNFVGFSMTNGKDNKELMHYHTLGDYSIFEMNSDLNIIVESISNKTNIKIALSGDNFSDAKTEDLLVLEITKNNNKYDINAILADNIVNISGNLELLKVNNIEKLDTSKAIDSRNLTENDSSVVLGNLYDLIDKLGLEELLMSGMDDDYYDDYDDDYDYSYDADFDLSF